jgi:phosphotriesterase-related protein
LKKNLFGTEVMINTVLGTISPDDLGKTLIHEHILFGFAGWYANNTMTPFNRETCLAAALNRIEDLKRHGLKTLVDATPNDSGRDPELLREIADKSGIHIICATGLYTESLGGSPYFKFRGLTGGDLTAEITELFVREITVGIEKKGIKAGIIKVGTGARQITAYEEVLLKAAARAQKATGVPIITHTDEGTMGPEQADLLLAEGADPGRILIGHMDGSADMNYHVAVLERGVFIAFDKLGMENFPSDLRDTVRKACIIGLIGIGHAGRIMLSHDSICCWLGEPFVTTYPTHVFENIIPSLQAAGVRDKDIHTIMIENPRRLFQ